MKKYIIKYLKTLLSIFGLFLCLLFIYAPMIFGCTNFIFIVIYGIAAISLLWTIGEWYFNKYIR